MIKADNILNYLKGQGYNTNINEIKSIIENINKQDIELTQKKRFKYEIWDKKTPINGIDAKTIIKSRKYPISQVYLIYIDNVLVYFQDHNPNKEGYIKMNKKEANNIAKNFINNKIEECVDSIIIDKIIQKIISK